MTTPGCPIVGIGASAGGLAALKTLFQHLPIDSGAAFVVIQHLDPKHASLTAEILARSTAMPTVQVSNGMQAQANHVYVIPPNAYLTLRGHRLELDEPVLLHGLRMPIDTFFWSLAEQHAARAVAVVLSGTGSDGTLGLRAVKGSGGLTMAQTPDTAQYDDMPRSAIATGLVDVVCPVKAMAQRLADYVYLITFEDAGTVAAPLALAKAVSTDSDRHFVQQLEYELGTMREELQGSLEEQQSANEELQAANEEVMSVNEELQSMNEELTTVNSQPSESVDDLRTSNNDLANLLSSTDIATLFLDTEFRIGRFTPATLRLFRLIKTDVGRLLPISDLNLAAMIFCLMHAKCWTSWCRWSARFTPTKAPAIYAASCHTAPATTALPVW